MRRAMALGVTVVLLVSGCTNSRSGAASTSATSPTAGTSPATATSPAAVAAATPAARASDATGPGATASGGTSSSASTPAAGVTAGSLAAAGIETVADETATVPQAPIGGARAFTLTAWQVANLDEEARGHGGIPGGDLSTMLPLPAGGPQLDDVIGAWVITHPDATSVTAAGLLDSPDWTHPDQVVFPTAVVMLFVADVLQHAGPPAAGASGTTSASPSGPGASSGAAATSGAAWTGHLVVRPASLVTAPCSTVSTFVDNVLDYIFGLLKLNPADVAAWVSGALGGGAIGQLAGGIAGFFAGLWNTAVSLAEQTAKQLLKSLTQPVLNALAVVIGGAAVFTMIRSYLKPWVMTVTPDPASNAFSVDPTPYNPGSFSLAVDRNAEIADWPPQMVDCAKATDIALPTLAAAGSPATWTVTGQEPGLVTTGPVGTVLDKDLRTTLDYRTGHEDAKTAKSGQLVSLTVTASVKVRRTEVEQLRALVTGYLTGKVPDILAPVVNPVITSYLEQATKFLDDLTAVTGVTTMVVRHHVPKPTPTPPSGCSGSATTIPAGTYSGPISATIKTVLHVGDTVQAAGSGTTTMTGTITLVSDGTKVTGRIDAHGGGTASVGLKGGPTFQDSSIGSMKGTLSGSASDPRAAGTLSGTDEAAGAQSAPFAAGLHLTAIGCSSITGDLVAMIREIEAPVAQFLTVSGSGSWTAPRQ